MDLCPACLLSTALATDGRSCPYHIVAPIAESRSGTTYLAQSAPRGRGIVALKILAARDDADEMLARYERWKPAIARVTSANVASVTDAGLTDEGLVYLASPFVPGWPLETIDEHKSIGPDARADIARQIAAAISAIHDAGLAHLAVDASHVRVSVTNGVHATLLGLGVRVVVDGDHPSADVDRIALAKLHYRLGVTFKP